MRIANVAGRSKLIVGEGQVDIEAATSGRFSSEPSRIFDYFDELQRWAKTISHGEEPWRPEEAGPPVPAPKQIFAVALNYVAHAAESKREVPTAPVIFTKFVSSLTGPVTTVELPEGSVDWEVELVAVVGTAARHVTAAAAWDHIAGLTLGQDLSERQLQRSGPAPQFGLAKSFAGFSPTGPLLVTPDEFDRPDDLGLGCEVNGEEVQNSRTSEMVFSIPEVVAYLSNVLTLFPGDLIFTGTPPGVGMGRTPARFLNRGDRLHSWLEGVGELQQTFA